MKRRLFTISAATSLAVCLAISYLWIRSHFVNDGFTSQQYTWHDIEQMQHVEKLIASSTGHVFFHTNTFQFKRSQDPKWNFIEDKAWSFEQGVGVVEFPKATFPNHLGFGVQDLSRAGTRKHAGAYVIGNESFHLVWIPYWLLFVLSAVLPAIWATKRWRRARRLRHGKCAVCGYDLRATPDRCPECGGVAI